MAEFITALLSPVNLALTVLLGLVLIYWLMVVVGALAFDALDVDLDADTDVDLDVDAEVDLDADVDMDADAGDLGHGAGGGAGLAVLRLVGVGDVPLMVLVSVFLLSLWTIGMLLHPVVGAWGVLAQVALLVPYAIAAIIIARIVTLPLAVFFHRLKQREKAEQKLDLIGKPCVVMSRRVTSRYGQVHVLTEGAPLLLNARLSQNNGSALAKGAEAVIVGKSEDGRYYTVRAF